MNHKPHITWKADKVCDVSMNQFEILNGRVNFEGTPVQLHLEMAAMTGAYSDGGSAGTSPEAGSLACFNTIHEVFDWTRARVAKNILPFISIALRAKIILGSAGF